MHLLTQVITYNGFAVDCCASRNIPRWGSFARFVLIIRSFYVKIILNKRRRELMRFQNEVAGDKNMKKLICIIIALVIFTFTVSCGKAEDASKSANDEAGGIDYLVLVNKENKLPDGWEEKLETVTVKNSLGDDVEVEKSAYDAYLRLKDALAAEGV